MYKTLSLATLCGFVSCGSTTGMQTSNLAFNIPGHVQEMAAQETRIRECFAKKECTSTWDPNLHYWIVRHVEQKKPDKPETVDETTEELK